MKILLADASEDFHKMLSTTLGSDGLYLSGWVKSSEHLLSAINEQNPDLLIMDMFFTSDDGFQSLDTVMLHRPLPVVMFCSLSCPLESDIFKEAVLRGAHAVLPKPSTPATVKSLIDRIKQLLRECGQISRQQLLQDYLMKRSQLVGQPSSPAKRIVGVVGSTGAVEVLRQTLSRLPSKFEATILVAQHMYGPVWKQFASVLGQVLPYSVGIAQGGEIFKQGRALLSPTDQTLMTRRVSFGGIAQLEKASQYLAGQIPLQPNLDAFLTSLAKGFGHNALAIVLSGIGESGVAGARAVREAGGQVWAQAPQSAIVASMPQAVVTAGLANRVLSSQELSAALNVMV